MDEHYIRDIGHRDPQRLSILSTERFSPTMSRHSVIPQGSWPRRMSAELAAGYGGEDTVEAFIKRVGTEYPQPRVNDGRRKLWLRDDLDQAILPPDLVGVRDLAEDL
jgi:hypothetical protein